MGAIRMTASIFHSPSAAHDIPPAYSLGDSSGVSCRPPLSPDVGIVARDPIRQAQDELDDTIRDLRTLAALAEDAGQIETAIEYTRRALAASRSRAPEHKDRLARERLAAVEASLDGGVDFFQAQGQLAGRSA